MSINLEIPRERYGIIAELAERMKAHHYSFGKTALQKLVYFLQELRGVECGYDFTLYTYGPFSSLLLSDLDAVCAARGVEIEYFGQQGYQITPGPKSSSLREHAKRFLEKNEEPIEQVVDEFGGLWAKRLELLATAVFAERDAKASARNITQEELTEAVHAIKPHFSEDEIKEAIRQLQERGHIHLLAKKKVVKAAGK
jgi:uncharacterized protein YwgA